MDRLSLAGTAAATALSLLAFATPGSAQDLSPAGAAPPATVQPRATAAKPLPGGDRRRFRLAYVVANVSLLAGPGDRYHLVQVIPEGTEVGVAKCSRGWCEVVWQRRRGFAPADAISIADVDPDLLYGEEPAYPVYYGGPSFYFGGPFGWGFGHRGGWHHHWHR